MSNSGEKLVLPQRLQDIMTEFTMIYLLDQPETYSTFIKDYSDYVKAFSHTEIKYDLQRKKSSGLLAASSSSAVDNDYKSYIGKNRKSFYQSFDNETEYVKVFHEKTDAQRQILTDAVGEVLLFSHLDSDDLNEIIDAMFEQKVKTGDVIISQGAIGDNFYVIQEGIFEVFITQPSELDEDEEYHVRTYNNEGSFGELALLYNQPRAATIKAATDGVIWALDRVTFKRIVFNSAMEKRSKYKHIIVNTPLFHSLTDYDINNLTDALVSRTYKAGECILRDCLETDGLYLIESGTVGVNYNKTIGDISMSKTLQTGDVFGEYGLIHGEHLITTTAFAVTDLKVAFLCKYAFERLLGNYRMAIKNIIGSTSISKIK